MPQPLSTQPQPPSQPRDSNSSVIAEPAIFVNAKQISRILHRRIARQKLTQKLKREATRSHKTYTHESRHKHAIKRPRGPGGRFLTQEELAASSREWNDSSKARAYPNVPSEDRVAPPKSPAITKDMTTSFIGERELQDLNRKYAK